jgi:hypothetical protein
VPYSPDHLDLTSFRSYLATRRHYSAEAIDLRLLLRTAPAELLTAPQLLAWMATSGQEPALVIYVCTARSLYSDACRVARRRAKNLADAQQSR